MRPDFKKLHTFSFYAMAEFTPDHSDRHFKYLDSARGIAALMVFASHFIIRNFGDNRTTRAWLILFNGNDAVSFFFVLSGFVLSYKYIVLSKPLDIKKFYVSRIFRLFPAYFLVIVWSILFAGRHFLNIYAIKDFFIYNKYGFWEEALLLRFHNTFYYPGWTLSVEMLGSFLIPFYVALAIYNKKLVPYLIVVLLIIGNNFFFSYIFLFGIVASCNFSEITGKSFRETKLFRYRYPLIIASLILFSLRQFDAIFPFGQRYKYIAGYLGVDFFTYSAPACFVFLVIMLCNKKLQHFLENRVLVYLGKISYSIYLVHVVVIDTIYLFVERYLAGPHYSIIFFMVTVCCILAIIAVASLLHYLVELPFIRLGKRIVNTMKPSLVIKRENNTAPAPD